MSGLDIGRAKEQVDTIHLTANSSSKAFADEITADAVRNNSYPMMDSQGKWLPAVYLVNGTVDQSITKGNGTVEATIDKKDIAFGDLNGDEHSDAAAVLHYSNSRSSDLTRLYAIINYNGEASTEASLFLGWKVQVNSLSIAPNGEVTIDEVSRLPNVDSPAKRHKITATYSENTEWNVLQDQTIEK